VKRVAQNIVSATRRRDFLVALSLANLCFVRVWGALLNPGNDYFLDRPLSWIGPAVASVGVLALGAVFFAAARFARRHPPGGLVRRAASLAFLATLLIAANALRQQASGLSFEALSSYLGQSGFWLVLSTSVLFAVVAWFKWGIEGLARSSTTPVLVLLPFAFLTLGQSALVALRSRSDAVEFHEKRPAPFLNSEPGAPRLLFLVFDALDQQFLTVERPTDVLLPEFDALLKTTVQWTNAYPPSNGTGVSLPALITGRDVVKVRKTAANELMLSFADSGSEAPWSQEPTLFTWVRRFGQNSSLIGWYHPYCRVLGHEVARCRWYPYVPNPAETLWASVFLQIALLADTVPGAFRFGFLDRLGGAWLRGSEDPGWHAMQYSKIHEQTLQAILDERLNLVFVHYPVPHSPFIYDRQQEAIRLDGKSTYIDNLALTDRTLKELRRALEASNLWERTALIITSDHWFRRPGWRERGEFAPVLGKPEHRVPLLVRLPGQTEAVVHDELLRSHAAHYLAIEILKGNLRGITDLERILRLLPGWLRPSS
jgi:hypothetical protein